MVLVQKKDGKLRFCIDLRRLNAQVIKDAYSLPQNIRNIRLYKWCSGFYECKRMPFRLTNIPATFQCLMLSCLGNLCLQYCIIYLDDIIVFSKTPEEHLDRLRAVFEQLKKAELKLKPLKYEFLKQELTYLGHVVSKNGSKKVEAIKK